jgi:hypothetical protein
MKILLTRREHLSFILSLLGLITVYPIASYGQQTQQTSVTPATQPSFSYAIPIDGLYINNVVRGNFQLNAVNACGCTYFQLVANNLTAAGTEVLTNIPNGNNQLPPVPNGSTGTGSYSQPLKSTWYPYTGTPYKIQGSFLNTTGVLTGTNASKSFTCTANTKSTYYFLLVFSTNSQPPAMSILGNSIFTGSNNSITNPSGTECIAVSDTGVTTPYTFAPTYYNFTFSPSLTIATPTSCPASFSSTQTPYCPPPATATHTADVAQGSTENSGSNSSADSSKKPLFAKTLKK